MNTYTSYTCEHDLSLQPFGVIPFCRICLENDTFDSFIAPCLCKGGSKYVHLRCIQTWISCNPNIKNKYNCMVCDSPFYTTPKFTSFLYAIYPGPFIYILISFIFEASFIFTLEFFFQTVGINTDMSLFISILVTTACIILLYIVLYFSITRSVINSDSLSTITRRQIISISLPVTALILVNVMMFTRPPYVISAVALFIICHFILSFFIQAVTYHITLFNQPINRIQTHPSHTHSHILQV
jgi:hypothetical protein